MAFSLTSYLDRIGLTDLPDGAAGIAALQEAQMRAITFENLTPLLGEIPDLAPDALVEKLVHRKRGGYCFEQNGLLRLALEALGYAPEPLLARVNGGARTHLAFEVKVEGAAWLVDAGFGGHGALRPIRLDSDEVQPVPNGDFRIRPAQGEWRLERRTGDDWTAQYALDFVPVRQVDIEAANVVTARWALAPFPNNLMLALHRPDGRVAAFNRALTRGLPPETTRELIENPDALGHSLREDFRLDVTPAEVARIWTKVETAPTER